MIRSKYCTEGCEDKHLEAQAKSWLGEEAKNEEAGDEAARVKGANVHSYLGHTVW